MTSKIHLRKSSGKWIATDTVICSGPMDTPFGAYTYVKILRCYRNGLFKANEFHFGLEIAINHWKRVTRGRDPLGRKLYTIEHPGERLATP